MQFIFPYARLLSLPLANSVYLCMPLLDGGGGLFFWPTTAVQPSNVITSVVRSFFMISVALNERQLIQFFPSSSDPCAYISTPMTLQFFFSAYHKNLYISRVLDIPHWFDSFRCFRCHPIKTTTTNMHSSN